MNRFAWLLFAFLIPQAWAATYYFNNLVGNGGDGTEGAPWNEISDEPDGIINAGDTWLFKAGTTWAQTALSIDTVDNWTIGAYGCSDTPCAKSERPVFDAEDTIDRPIEIINSEGWQLRDVGATNATNNVIYIENDNSETWTWADTAVLRVTANNACAVTAAGSADEYCNGLYIYGGAALATCCGLFEGFVADTIYAEGNGGMGVHAQSVRTNIGGPVIIRNSMARNNGGKKAGGNYWFHPQRGTQSGWTLAGTCAGCYNWTAYGSMSAQYVINEAASPDAILTEGTFNALNANEYAQSGLTIQARITGDTDPDATGGLFIVLSYSEYLIENSFSYDSIAFDNIHGWGIAFDGYVSNSIARRNFINGTSGWGIHLDGFNNIAESNIVINAGKSTAHLGNSRACISTGATNSGNIARNNVLHNCGQDGFINTGNSTSSYYNNSIGTVGRSGFRSGSGGTLEGSNNNHYDDGAAEGGGGTSNLTDTTSNNPKWVGGTNPNTANGFRLKDSSPLIGIGTIVGSLQDYGNRRFKYPPSIGALEYGGGDQRDTTPTTRTTFSTRSSNTSRTTYTSRNTN